MFLGFNKRGSSGFHRSSGAVLVELAIVVPVLVTLIFASLDYGRLVYANQEMTRILNEGLRLASKNRGITIDAPNGSLGCTIRKWSICNPASPDYNLQNCPVAYKDIMVKMNNLMTRYLTDYAEIKDIIIDYDLTTFESDPNPQIDARYCDSLVRNAYEEDGFDGLPPCLRTIAAEIRYILKTKSIFFRDREYKVASRFPFLGIGDEGVGQLCQ